MPTETLRKERDRLPDDVTPMHYDLEIKTDLKTKSFEGTVSIELRIREDIKRIVLHALDLTFEKEAITVMYTPPKTKQVAKQPHKIQRGKWDQVTLEFKDNIPKGSSNATLEIKFKARLTDELKGYYYCTWDESGKEDCYAVTHFQPNSSRRAFPCWDEIDKKATYNITMISRRGTVNLSNMEVAEEKSVDNEWKATKFKKSPAMSTYLVAFANGPFKQHSLKGTKGIPMHIYGTSDIYKEAEFALKVKHDVLPVYEQMFRDEYPLKKLDTLIVHNLDLGAMENWGLITGRDSTFCMDDEGDVLLKREVIMSMCHEVSHMWFGNITTPKTWGCLYLNEGFATFIGEVIAIEELRSKKKGLIDGDWEIRSSFINEHLEIALTTDAKLSSHALEVECPDTKSAMQLFDNLSYHKGASVFMMLSDFVGQDKFLFGVSNYLREHKYSNATSDQLWSAISSGIGNKYSIAEIMKNWVKEKGFPYLTVTEDETRNTITIRQDRFLSKRKAKPEENTKWQVPLTIVTKSDGGTELKREVLRERSMTISLNLKHSFKINRKASGFYRVLYSPERLKIFKNDRYSLFRTEDHIGLLNDMFALANAGIANIGGAMSLLEDFSELGNSCALWQCIQSKLTELQQTFSDDPSILDLITEFCTTLFAPLVEKLPDYSAGGSPTALETIILCGAAENMETRAVNRLNILYHKRPNNIPSDLERATYVSLVKSDPERYFSRIQSIYETTKIGTTRKEAIYGMCASPNDNHIDAVIKLTFDPTKVKDQNVFFFIDGLALNPKARHKIANEFLRRFNDKIFLRFEGSITLPALVRAAFRRFTKESDARKYNTAMKKFSQADEEINRELDQAIETVLVRAGQYNKLNGDVKKWLLARKSTGDAEQSAPELHKAKTEQVEDSEEPPKKQASAHATKDERSKATPKKKKQDRHGTGWQTHSHRSNAGVAGTIASKARKPGDKK